MKRSAKIKDRIDLKNYIEHRSGQQFKGKKMKCPLPGHEDIAPSFSISADGRSWHCYGACDKGGDVIAFVMALDGVDFPAALDILDPGGTSGDNGHAPASKTDMSKAPEEPPQKQGRTPYKCMQHYFNKKYKVSVKVPEKWGCKDTTMGGNPAVAIPTVDDIPRLRNLGATGPKYKPDSNNPIVIQKRKRREEKKKRGETILPGDFVQAQWFGLQEAQEVATSEHLGKTLVLCNGQTSTMVAQHYGVPAFCKTDGENVIPQWLIPELVTLLVDGWKLFVALDCDNDGKGHAVAVKIAMQLYQYKPTFIDLGGQNGYDLADFCDKHRDRSWDTLPEFIAPLPVNLVDQAAIDINAGLREIAQAQRSKSIDTLPELVDQIENRLQVIKASYEVPEVGRDPVAEAYEQFQASQSNPQWITGLRTGLTDQDRRLGGLNEGIYTWAAVTGMGKTTLMMSMAAHLLGQQPGMIVIGEASDRQIVNRLVGYLSHVPWKSLRTGLIKVAGANSGAFRLVKHTSEQVENIQAAYLKVKLWRDRGELYLRDRTKPMNTISLQNQLRTLCRERGVKWAIMESVDNIPTPGADSEYAKISQAMFAFEDMATENGIPILTSSQAGRNTKGRANKVVGLHDPLGSNHVEGKSYALMSIYNHWLLVANGDIVLSDGDEEMYPPGTARIYVKKTRDDETGHHVVVKWEGGIGFYDLAKGGVK
jgi:replicative DNA helicase